MAYYLLEEMRSWLVVAAICVSFPGTKAEIAVTPSFDMCSVDLNLDQEITVGQIGSASGEGRGRVESCQLRH